jgi:type IV secretory pathway VirJ component
LARLACFYGQDEDDESPCVGLDAAARVRALPGGHHFNGAYGDLVSQITVGMSW